MRMQPLAFVVAVVACGAQLPARNDPATASGFYCSVSSTIPDSGVCTVDDKPSCDGTVADAASKGAFMSPCLGSTMAWCVVATFEGPPAERVFHCGPTRFACLAARENVEGIRYYSNVGECIERTAGR